MTRVQNVFSIETTKSDNIIKTPLVGTDKDRLLSIVNEFSEHFITGTATSTVKTGSMFLLLSNNSPIVYRHYRLSHEEKLRVR